jgi:hypothetical protein
MIVLDEELQDLGLEEAISDWYRGSVLLVKTLRPGTVIKDEAIPGLLRRIRQPTFVTINHGDFWRRVTAGREFCLLCLRLTADQADEVPRWLRRLFRLSEFHAKNRRAVTSVTRSSPNHTSRLSRRPAINSAPVHTPMHIPFSTVATMDNRRIPPIQLHSPHR